MITGKVVAKIQTKNQKMIRVQIKAVPWSVAALRYFDIPDDNFLEIGDKFELIIKLFPQEPAVAAKVVSISESERMETELEPRPMDSYQELVERTAIELGYKASKRIQNMEKFVYDTPAQKSVRAIPGPKTIL